MKKTRSERFVEYIKNVHEIRNLTPHEIRVIGEVNVVYEPSTPLRIRELLEPFGQYLDTRIDRKTFTDVDLPKFEEGVLNLVSLPVAQYVQSTDRIDFVTPGELVRDGSGNIIGCMGFHFID